VNAVSPNGACTIDGTALGVTINPTFGEPAAPESVHSPPSRPRAQQSEYKRIAVLMNTALDDKEGQAGVAAFRQGLQLLGWTDGDNVLQTGESGAAAALGQQTSVGGPNLKSRPRSERFQRFVDQLDLPELWAQQKSPGFLPDLRYFDGIQLNSPYRPFHRRASPGPRFPSSAFRQPLPQW
jgi:hypothetical protein